MLVSRITLFAFYQKLFLGTDYNHMCMPGSSKAASKITKEKKDEKNIDIRG